LTQGLVNLSLTGTIAYGEKMGERHGE